MTSDDETPGNTPEEPLRPPLTPGEGLYDRFARMTGVPPEAAEAMKDAVRRSFEEAGIDPGTVSDDLAATIEAQAQQFAGAREMNLMSMGMQAAGLHECFVSLVGAGFPEPHALYFMAKCSPGL